MLNREPSEDARHVARSAARWLALVESGAASDRDLAGLQRWRDTSDAHERAWQRVQALKRRFGGLPPELAMASLDRPEAGRRRLIKGMLGVATVVPTGWLVTRELPIEAWRADLATATGEQRRLTLDDGSVLDLNTATAVNLDAARRHLTLVRGEIGLRLAQPGTFSIDTHRARVVLHAGELCVRQDDRACEFSLFAGSADIRPSRYDALVLRAGQRVRLTDKGAGAIQRFDVQQPGWREGVLVANDQALGDFLRELDRYRPGILRWSPALEALRVTGSFRLDDTDRILDLLAASLPVEVRSRTRYWVTLEPRQANRVG